MMFEILSFYSSQPLAPLLPTEEIDIKFVKLYKHYELINKLNLQVCFLHRH